jgi:hypothetical protein
MKTRPVETQFLRADGQTDMTMLTEIFCNFTNGPKNEWDCTATHPHTVTYGQGQQLLHISYSIRKTVHDILVRRNFSSLHPYLIQILQKKSVPRSERNRYSP